LPARIQAPATIPIGQPASAELDPATRDGGQPDEESDGCGESEESGESLVVAGAGLTEGDGDGDCEGDGDSEGDGDGELDADVEGVGLAEWDGDGLGECDGGGVGEWLGFGVGLGAGVGVGFGVVGLPTAGTTRVAPKNADHQTGAIFT
jgi:hypothetical protein